VTVIFSIPIIHIKTLIFHQVFVSKLEEFLPYLNNSNCLSYLSISIVDYSEDMNNIYQNLLRLRVLKYLKFTILESTEEDINMESYNDNEYQSPIAQVQQNGA
jgi:hypothetical protein